MHAYIDNNCLTFRLVTTMNFSFNKNSVLKGTVILTLAGIISRIAGFFYRIFLSRSFPAEEIGLYQLIFPVYTLAYAATSAGIETALARLVAASSAKKQSAKAYSYLKAALLCSLFLSICCLFLLQKCCFPHHSHTW